MQFECADRTDICVEQMIASVSYDKEYWVNEIVWQGESACAFQSCDSLHAKDRKHVLHFVEGVGASAAALGAPPRC